MKKRVLCLLLGVIMALGTVLMTGCEDDEVIDYIAALDEDAKTITIYSITAESTTDEAIQKVQDKMNVFTESIYNTHVILRLLTEDEYESFIDQAIVDLRERKAEEDKRNAARVAALKALTEIGFPHEQYGKLPEDQVEPDTEAVPDTEAETEAETKKNGYEGVRKTVYPEEEGTQVDIFLLKGYDMFVKYQDILAPLDAYMDQGKNRMLGQTIYPELLNNVRIDGSTLGVPVNHPIGEYEYAFINKELADKYSYDVTYFTSAAKVEEFLNDILRYETDITPMIGTVTPYVIPFVKEIPYLGMAVAGGDSSITNLFNQAAVMSAYRTALNYGDDTVLTPEILKEKAGTVAVAAGKGTYSMREWADPEDYYTAVLQVPVADHDEVFESVYAVSTFTRNVDRALEIITYFNTNPEFADLFHYGIEDEHYEINRETGLVERLNDEYMMGLYDTGNVYMLTPSADMDEDLLALAANNWEDSKLQNLDCMESPYMDYHFDWTEFNFTTEVTVEETKYRREEDPETGEMIRVEYKEQTKTQYRPMTETYPIAKAICDEITAALEAVEFDENGMTVYQGKEMNATTFLQTLSMKLRSSKEASELMIALNPNAFANFLYRTEQGTWDGKPDYEAEYVAEDAE